MSRFDRFLTTTEAAAFLGVRPGTMYAWRHRGIGPRFHAFGVHKGERTAGHSRVLYSLSALEAFQGQVVSAASVIPRAYWGRPPGSKNRKGKALARSPLAALGGTVSPVERLPPSRASAPGPGQKRSGAGKAKKPLRSPYRPIRRPKAPRGRKKAKPAQDRSLDRRETLGGSARRPRAAGNPSADRGLAIRPSDANWHEHEEPRWVRRIVPCGGAGRLAETDFGYLTDLAEDIHHVTALKADLERNHPERTPRRRCPNAHEPSHYRNRAPPGRAHQRRPR